MVSRALDETTTVLYCSTPSLCLDQMTRLSPSKPALDGKLKLNWKRREKKGRNWSVRAMFPLHCLPLLLPSLRENSTTERRSKHQTFGTRRRRSQLSTCSYEHADNMTCLPDNSPQADQANLQWGGDPTHSLRIIKIRKGKHVVTTSHR